MFLGGCGRFFEGTAEEVEIGGVWMVGHVEAENVVEAPKEDLAVEREPRSVTGTVSAPTLRRKALRSPISTRTRLVKERLASAASVRSCLAPWRARLWQSSDAASKKRPKASHS